jgi:DNA-binding transcriptional ArsR family regulator
MARAATTADVFNAVAEPKRREIIDLLSGGQEWAVNDVVAKMKIRQPEVSKHLLVLRKVGVVTVTKQGRERLYRLDAVKLKPIIDWVKAHEQHWSRDRESIRGAGAKGTSSSGKISRRALNRNYYQASMAVQVLNSAIIKLLTALVQIKKVSCTQSPRRRCGAEGRLG